MVQNALVVLKVSCVMAGDNIPASLCETEQGGMLCSGCQAPTRRCASCNQARGIADARRGLCSKCLASDAREASAYRSNAQQLEDASNDVLDLIDRMSEEKPVANEAAGDEAPKRGGPRSAGSAPETKRLNSDLALRVLGEHGVNKPDGQFVPHPARVLALRFGLLPAEAMSAVQELSDSGKIALHSESVWRFLVDVSDVIRDRDENFTTSGLPTRALSPRHHSASTTTVNEKSRVSSKRNPKTASASLQTVYLVLQECAQTVDGKLAVRGPIPLLLTRMRLRTHEAVELLEKLGASGHVVQVDEWRSIHLLGAPAIVAPEIAVSLPQTIPQPSLPAKTRRDPFTGIPVRRVEPQQRKPQHVLPTTTEASMQPTTVSLPPIPVPTPVDTKSSREKQKAPKIAEGPTVSDLFDTICRMSTDLGGERLARAVVPTLSMRLSIGIPDIIAALERLERQKAIQRKDGWRSIMVLVDRVVDDHPVKTVLPSARERAEKLNLRVVEGGEQSKPVQPVQKPHRAPKRPQAASSSGVSPGYSVSEELSELRRTVEELNRKVADLAVSSQTKAKEPAPKPEDAPKLPKIEDDQHELLWSNELWLTDVAIVQRLGELSHKSYSVRQFHIKVAPLANGVRVAHGLCSDGSVRAFYSSKDVLKILHKKIFGPSK